MSDKYKRIVEKKDKASDIRRLLAYADAYNALAKKKRKAGKK